uniref:dolichyl-P-Man:Man5GlcNAc2-PP-dolichol alpha-1,3-mannosyltransferase n=1 Tax=Salix viminalis TaxID=40686 RepID=A0A6N2M8V9_SALVM
MALKSGRKLQPSRSRRPQIFKNPKAAFALALISMDALLVALIIAYVPYTKIDWDAYMSQVTGFLGGERDYTNLKGDTGPLVYPAGFLYIYSAIRFITGGEVYPAQILFGILYTINLSIVIFIYVKTEVLPWWALILLSLSKRVHSIFVLRLFNDCFAMTLLHAALATLLYQKWHLGLILFSGAVSIKMNVLLYAPPLLLLMLKAMNIYGVISALACAALVQILVGLPFLVSYPVAYISGAFNLGRVSVNFKFIPEPVFVSKQFAISLLIAHLGLLAAFAHYKWCRHEGGLFKFLHSKVISALSSSSSSGLKILKEEHIMTTLFAGNFIGILALSIVENTFPNITPVWSFAGISILQTFIHLLFFSVFICLYSGAYGLLNLNILMRKMNCPPERSKNEYPKFFFSFVSEEFSLSSDDGHDSEDPKQSTADMTAFVQRLLQQMSIDELRAEMGVEGSPSPLAPSKVMTEEDSA